MQLGWNEIKQRAVQFSREGAGETREDAEAKSFWDAFFNVFGIPRRRTSDESYLDIRYFAAAAAIRLTLGGGGGRQGSGCFMPCTARMMSGGEAADPDP